MQGSIENANFDGVFSQLLDDERAAVRAQAEVRAFADSDTIIQEETEPDAVYIITKGRVRVTKGISGNLSADFAGPLGLGEVIGEMSFIDGSSTSATLIADGEVETIRLAHADLRDMIGGDPMFGGRLYQSFLLVLIARLRVVNTLILLPFF